MGPNNEIITTSTHDHRAGVRASRHARMGRNRTAQTSKMALRRAALLVLMIASFALLSHAALATVSCSGRQIRASDNLARAAKSSLPGTTFCIHDGLYEVKSSVAVQSRDRFIGVYNDNSRPTVRGVGVKEIFEAGGSDGALIRGLRITGAVGNDRCEPECGRAIRAGNNLTVANVRLDHNENQGIGGAGPNLTVRDSQIDHNGSHSFARDGGPISTAGIKSVNSMTVVNSHIHDNYWAGVWCDLECGAFQVRDSIIENNGKTGIHYEISSGPAVVEGNIIRNNGILSKAEWHTGLLIVSSARIRVQDNRFVGNARQAVKILQDHRRPTVRRVSILSNILYSEEDIDRCSLRGVRCSENKRRT